MRVVNRRGRPVTYVKPDWRDPNMPVHYETEMYGERLLVQATPEQRSEMSESTLRFFLTDYDWRDDPTYNLRRRK